jgi:nitrate/TMAO reductase-like tetraheme cytochrome c subunit
MGIALFFVIGILTLVLIGLIVGFFIIRQQVLNYENNPNQFCATVVCPDGQLATYGVEDE